MVQLDFNKVHVLGETKVCKVCCVSRSLFYLQKINPHIDLDKIMPKSIQKRQKRIAYKTCERKTLAEAMQKLYIPAVLLPKPDVGKTCEKIDSFSKLI